MKWIATCLLVLLTGIALGQQPQTAAPGIITGNLQDEKQKALANATVQLIPYKDSAARKQQLTDKEGSFGFTGLAMGYYRLRISYTGFQTLQLDSIYLRTERHDFNLPDLVLHLASSANLEEVIVFAEKPLIESKEGNITFNASASALSAGSTANELLKTVPLVSSDADGKLTVRGKEPRILIDDKPVQLNAQQLQDLLESMPGSSIEKIEVMTNPPPQYANEQGGVINIVTRKGRVGFGGRINVSAGSRGEYSTNTNINYRKNKLAINFLIGAGYNRFNGGGYTNRENIYTDSSNYFSNVNQFKNRNVRPNTRLSIDYDFDKRNLLNVQLLYNQGISNNQSWNEYTNRNQFKDIYRLSERNIRSEGKNYNPSLNITYTHKGKLPGEQLRIIAGSNYSYNQSDRYFFQEFFNPDHTPNGIDSTQQQFNKSRNNGFTVNIGYDKPLGTKKTYLSTGVVLNRSNSHIIQQTNFLKKPDGEFVQSDLLSNDFKFHQTAITYRASARQIIKEGMSVTAGLSFEQTLVAFALTKLADVNNNYNRLLPFVNFNRMWKDRWNLTFAYRRTIRRPGIGEMNPSIDYGDPYNIRFGNPYLKPSLSHNFDVVTGKTTAKFFFNFGVGFNKVEDIYQTIRTLLPDGKTQVTWDNISNRQEYELSHWGGYTLSKKMRLNYSASYTYNQYSLYDRTKNRYRNGGSFTSGLNANYIPTDVLNFTGNFTFNRFANPQGLVRWTVSMNIGAQYKFFKKKFIVTVNTIDPFIQQRYRSITYGRNFINESYSTTRTRNYRITLAYTFNRAAKKPAVNKTATPLKVKKPAGNQPQ
ncbi:MAG: TonB-dependent receptor [Flavihumibacter sp.]|nr:TonB-dependent receptor [Flavihumibacter sp.]